MLYGVAKPQAVQPALRLVLGANGKVADEGAVVDFLQFAEHRGVRLEDLWVAERGGRVIWATLPIVSPGRTMLILAPGGRPKETDGDTVAGTLIDTACQHFAAKSVLLAQVLLDPGDSVARAIYLGRSFQQVAELLYLQADIRRTYPAPPLPNGCEWVSYSSESHDDFAATIVQSYHDSLDCPGLNGLRDIEDVIVSHKSSGTEFDPKWWLVLRENGKPVAVLLLARAHLHRTAELVYLGLAPAARGRGFGDVVMRQALHLLATNDIGTLALAVDSQNEPALRLYYRHGLRRVGSKIALMRKLQGESPSA